MTWMASEIEERGGCVPFVEYMRLALYHPVHGYYSGAEPRYGRRGDFVTAPTASAWYGRVSATFLTALAERVGAVTLVDLAAGNGAFLGEVREALGSEDGLVLERLVGIEKSAAMRGLARDRLGEACELAPRLAEVATANGPVVLHASELYDALPVARVVGTGVGIDEYWVGLEEGDPVWRRRPADAALVEYFSAHGVTLAEDQVAEVNLEASAVHAEALEWAGEDGLALVLDYGYPSARLYDPRGRSQGSLACYRRHELGRDPLLDPGELDITAHVNWDDLRTPAGRLEWSEIGNWALAEWLVRAGLERVMGRHGIGVEKDIDAATYTERQEVKRLLDPEGMGSDLKMLIQGRGPTGDAVLDLLDHRG